MTAEEFIYNHCLKIYNNMPDSFKKFINLERYIDIHWYGQINGKEKSNKDLMIEFAKLHVEAALKAVNKNVIVNNYGNEGGIRINKNSILNAYPLENIK